MWIVSRRRLLERASLLWWAASLIAATVAAILTVILLSAPVYAAEVSWENGALRYDNRTYQGPNSAAANSPYGLAEGAQYFEARDGNTVRILSFPQDANLDEVTGAQFAQYRFTPPDTYVPDGGQRTVSLEKRTDAEQGDERREEGTTSCAVNAIGYILCPFMNFIANSMDVAFSILSSFLNVPPLSMNQDTSLYKVWSYMLMVANVLFVIALLVVVGSYVSSIGLKQHDVRYILPRLIVASILVNISYHVCALLIDLSNLVGFELQNIFEALRESIVHSDAIGDFKQLTWSNVTGYVLSGGTLLGGAVVFLGTALPLGPAAVFMLFPILSSAIIALIVAVLILAARQALIIVLVILAPLAFVAYILPGTQKYFNRWQGLFMNMLLVFPLFSLLFGGSQLAAFIIAQNAKDIQTVLFAMFIQVAPLVITPFLIKFSGQLLGKIAGMINNPSKGLKDRTDAWAQDKRDNARARRLQEQNRGWKKTPGIALAQQLDGRKRKREGMRKIHEATRNAQFDQTDIGQMLASRTKQAEQAQQIANNMNEAAWQRAKLANGQIQVDSVKAHLSEVELKADKGKAEEYMQGLLSRQGLDVLHAPTSTSDHDLAIRSLARRAQDASHRAHAATSATQMALNQERLEYADDMLKGDHAEQMQIQAAGIAGDKGRMLAAAQAVQEMRSDFGKSAGAMKEMMDHFKVSGPDVNKLARKEGNVTVDLGNGKEFVFRADDEHAVDAAIESVFEKKGNYANMRDIVKLSGTEAFADHRATISAGVAKNMVAKAGFMGGSNIDVVNTGGVSSPEVYDDLIRMAIAGGKFKQDFFATNDTAALEDVYSVMKSRKSLSQTTLTPEQQASYLNRVQNLASMARATLENENITNNLTAGSIEVLDKIKREFGGDL